jgi:GNAT superfamily N-acetyltransferase
MSPDDVAGVAAVVDRTLPLPPGAEEDGPARARFLARLAWPQRTDPSGCWVAERGDGTIGAVAQAIVRERLWGLSLLAVDDDLRGRGLARDLLERALRHGERRGVDTGLIVSSEHPAAMRRYARAGFALHAALSVAGIPVLDAAPPSAWDVPRLGPEGLAVADAIGRAVRGAGYGDDLGLLLDGGARLLLVEDRAFALAREGRLLLLAARDEDAARLVLWAVLVTAPPGATVSADGLTAGQQWAIRTALDARLALSPAGPLATRGRRWPPAPYLPSGAFL